MDLPKNHRQLIEDIIKENDRYYGNEDLLEAFCSDVYKKSYLLLDSVSNVDNLKSYLQKVVDTSVSNILGQNGRDSSPKQKPVKSNKSIELIEDTNVSPNIPPVNSPEARMRADKFKQVENRNRPQNLKEDRLISIKDDSAALRNLSRDIYADVSDPKVNYPEIPLKENVVNKILGIVFELHARNPEKGYFQIFYARHAGLKKQAVIASELRLTQGELSKRYLELIKLIREQL